MKRKAIVVILSLLLVFNLYSPVSAEISVPDIRSSRLEELNYLSNGQLSYYKKDGQVFLSGKLSDKNVSGTESTSEFLEKNKSLLGLNNTDNELKIAGTQKGQNGDTYIKYLQTIDGLEVYGHTLTVHIDKSGIVRSVNGDIEKNTTVTALGSTAISAGDAISIAEKQFSYKNLRNTPAAKRMIFQKDSKNYEVYKINISYTEPEIENYDVYIEDHSGKIIQIESNLRYDGSVTGTGTNVQGNTVSLNLYQQGSEYVMKDITKTGIAESLCTYDMEHGDTYGYLVENTGKSFSDENSKASVSAHYNGGQVIDFYSKLFNRKSIDNNCMEVDSYTHYKTDYDNAFWDGSEMVYGDGDGTEFTYLSGDLGIVGHEMTHGVIDNTAKLDYNNQPGALCESLADTFGVLIKTYTKYNVANGGTWKFVPSDWVIGEDVYTPYISGDALRSLADPTLYDQPDNMSNYRNLPDTEDGDYGGVHDNSGITSKAAYLIAKSIGMEKTAKIYYQALVKYMGAYTDFAGAENCLKQAAADLYPSTPAVKYAVENAFTSVGIDHISSVNMKTDPARTTYIKGQALNPGGAVITVSFGDGSTEDISVTSDMISGYNADTLGNQTVTVTYDGKITSFVVTVLQQVSAAYQGYIQNKDWQGTVSDGALCGTTGQNLRLEALKINIQNAPQGLNIEYKAHVQNIGWQDWVENGDTAGIAGKGLRIEALQIRLRGTDAQYYSVEYQTHVQNVGWQDSVYDGMTAGTTGRGLRIEALRIKIVPKIPDVAYGGHVQNIGWQIPVRDGDLCGTTGRGLRIEALMINLENAPYGLNIEYRAHVQNIGWQGWVANRQIAGTTGRGLRVEALEIKLIGTDADKYEIKYQTHVQNVGWQDWVSNGVMAGTVGRGLRIEAIRIKIVPKL